MGKSGMDNLDRSNTVNKGQNKDIKKKEKTYVLKGIKKLVQCYLRKKVDISL